MKINSIEYSNFRNFKNEGKVSFATDGRVNIVYGRNGDGKTTFHQLFQWIIYGETHFNKTTTDKMYNLELEQDLPYNTKFYVQGKIDFEHKNREGNIEYYSVKRKWTYVKEVKESKKIDEEFVLLKKNENDDWKSINEPELAIEEMLPKSLSEYFFFDGESMVADLKQKGKDSAVKLKKTLYSMFDMNIYQSASIHIGAIDKKGSVIGTIFSEKTSSDSEEQQKVKNEIVSVQKLLEEYNDKISKGTEECEKLNETIKTLSEMIGSVNTKINYEEKRRKLKEQITGFESLITSTKYSFGKEVAEKFPKLLIAKAVENATKKITLQIESDKLIPGLSKKLIDSLQKEDTCICGRPLSESEKSYLKNYYRLLPPKSLKGLYDDFKNSTRECRNAYDSEMLSTYVPNIIQLQNSIVQALEEINDLDEMQRANAGLQKQIDDRCEAESKLEKQKTDLQADREQLSKIRMYFNQQRKKLSELSKDMQNNEIVDKKIYIMEKVKEYFDNKLQEVSVEYSNKLQKEIQNLINIMLTSQRKVQMNEDFFFKVYDNFGDESKSEGQFAVVSFAYIGAILKLLKEEENLSCREYPLILDGPFSKLDPIQKQNVINVIPEYAPQVILFSKDDLTELIKEEKVGKIWTIQSNIHKNVAEIKEGMLWK